MCHSESEMVGIKNIQQMAVNITIYKAPWNRVCILSISLCPCKAFCSQALFLENKTWKTKSEQGKHRYYMSIEKMMKSSLENIQVG